MKFNVYVVIKEGIYMQGIVGVFSAKNAAIEAANIAIISEKDDYHEFYIDKFMINQIRNSGLETDLNNYYFAEEVYRIKRKGNKVTLIEKSVKI